MTNPHHTTPRATPIDVSWMQEVLDEYLDDLGWPTMVSSSAIEDAVVARYPHWTNRRQRLREIITKALRAAGYVRTSENGRGWSRESVARDIPRQTGAWCDRLKTGGFE